MPLDIIACGCPCRWRTMSSPTCALLGHFFFESVSLVQQVSDFNDQQRTMGSADLPRHASVLHRWCPHTLADASWNFMRPSNVHERSEQQVHCPRKCHVRVACAPPGLCTVSGTQTPSGIVRVVVTLFESFYIVIQIQVSDADDNGSSADRCHRLVPMHSVDIAFTPRTFTNPRTSTIVRTSSQGR